MIHYGRWTLEAGDPGFLGWFTCSLYFCTGICCIVSYKLEQRHSSKKSQLSPSLFWIAVSTFFILLGFNKQLDLHCLIIEIGRNLSLEQGWYQYRREVQLVFMLGIIFLSASMLFLTVKNLSAFNKYQFLVLSGALLTLLYVLTKAVLFTHTDNWIPLHFTKWRTLWVIEITGLAIGLSATIKNITSILNDT